MLYSIKQVSEQTGLSSHTLRYYEREGVLPAPARSAGNMRRFSQADVQWLMLLTDLKTGGMPLEQIKVFARARSQEHSPTPGATRADLESLRAQAFLRMEAIKRTLETLDNEIARYMPQAAPDED